MNEAQTLSRIEILLERKIHRSSFYEFYKEAFCQLHPGLQYDENWHARYLCDVLQEETERVLANKPREKDIIINISPRSSKSMIVTVIWPVWMWTLTARLKFLTCSYSDTIATNLSRQSKDLIETVWFRRLYGNKVSLRGDLQGAGHYGTTDGGFRYAFGADGTVTGMGGDFLICDDLQNPRKANSEVERDSTIERYNGTISNRINQLEIGSRVIVMQRLHMRDIVGYLLDEKEGRPDSIRHICIPAEYDQEMVKPPELKKYYDDQGGLFWPSRFSNAVLSDEKRKGSLYFAGQFQQRPVPLEGNIFKRKWFDIIEPELVERDHADSPIHFLIDTAYTEDETETNDPSGILSCFRKGEFLYIVNFVEVWMEFPKLIDFIKQYCTSHGYSPYSGIYIEPKANGKSVAQQLKSGTGLNVIEIEADWIRDDKVTRATAVSPIAEARRVKIVNGPYVDHYLGQLTAFPKAPHDEAVDCTVYALNKLLPLNEFYSAMI